MQVTMRHRAGLDQDRWKYLQENCLQWRMLVTSSISPSEAARRSRRDPPNRQEWLLCAELPPAVCSLLAPPRFQKKKKKKPWSPFCILKLHPVQKCSGKICSCTVSWCLLNVFWFGKFLSAFLVAASRLRNQERRTLAAQHRGPEAGTFRKRWPLESQMLKKWFCLSTLAHFVSPCGFCLVHAIPAPHYGFHTVETVMSPSTHLRNYPPF